MTLVGVALPIAAAGPILNPMAVPEGRLGIGVGQVTTNPVEVCDQVSALVLPSNETEPIELTSKFELVASEAMASWVPAVGIPK